MRPVNSKSRPMMALAGVAALFALAQAGPGTSIAAGGAMAAPPEVNVPFNAAEQRKQMILRLTELDRRLARIEAKLDGGLSVRVTEMPPIVFPNRPDDTP